MIYFIASNNHMDKIDKFLNKLNIDDYLEIKSILKKISLDDYSGLDIKKLKGFKDIFRIRKGKIRIIFQKDSNGSGYYVLDIHFRNEKTYKNY